MCDLRGGYTLRSSGRCGLVFKLDGVGMGALNAELRRFEVSTDGHWCQFSINRSPQFGVWYKGRLYLVQIALL